MGTRSIEEIQKSIQSAYDEWNYLNECAGLYYDAERGWKYKNTLVIPRMNETLQHIHNLKLELNRAKQRQWGKNK